jgi:hypothetical protein
MLFSTDEIKNVPKVFVYSLLKTIDGLSGVVSCGLFVTIFSTLYLEYHNAPQD